MRILSNEMEINLLENRELVLKANKTEALCRLRELVKQRDQLKAQEAFKEQGMEISKKRPPNEGNCPSSAVAVDSCGRVRKNEAKMTFCNICRSLTKTPTLHMISKDGIILAETCLILASVKMEEKVNILQRMNRCCICLEELSPSHQPAWCKWTRDHPWLKCTMCRSRLTLCLAHKEQNQKLLNIRICQWSRQGVKFMN